MSPRNKLGKKTYSYSGPFQKGVTVAEHYGFNLAGSLKGVRSLKTNTEPRSVFQKQSYIDPVHKKYIHAKHLDKKDAKNGPLALSLTHGSNKKNGGGLNLYIVGSPKGIAEALLIKTSMTILKEYNKKDFIVDINSLGDVGTYKAFLKDFSGHYRKNINVIGDCCRTKMKNSVPLLAECSNEECLNIRREAPRSIGYLTENGRTHFKSVLEYLESIEIPYRINCDLVGEGPEFGTQTVFTISEVTKNASKIVARGERYNRCHIENQNRKIPSTVCMSIDIPGGRREEYKVSKDSDKKSPGLYLIHLGVEAKRQSLSLIETLRRQNIEIRQSLVFDGLSQQMQQAESLAVPYSLIVGLKEVKERSVIVRNMNTRAQETVPINNLVRYIKYIHRL